MTEVKRLGYCVDGVWKQSTTSTYLPITDSNTGEVIAETPMCTEAEVTEAIESAHAAFGPWASMPITRRTQVLFKYRALM
ncbi:MAG TPA: aldehyde dehydrogenase family protein, partial [Thermoleophilia bacterium]